MPESTEAASPAVAPQSEAPKGDAKRSGNLDMNAAQAFLLRRQQTAAPASKSTPAPAETAPAATETTEAADKTETQAAEATEASTEAETQVEATADAEAGDTAAEATQSPAEAETEDSQ